VNETPLRHPDDLTVSLCHYQMRNSIVTEVGSAQSLRRAGMILGLMTFDEVGNHPLDLCDVILVGIADGNHIPGRCQGDRQCCAL
jgi:hypothetical protein